ncbi:MAG: antitoxin of system [Subtercola sp.]|jgi:prevent-host-death family protein|nr:antitoxin of system [Subtercola sp.]
MTKMIDECSADQLDLVNMTEIVNVQDAKTRLSELLARVEQGEDFILARSGKPIAKLLAVEQTPRRELGFAPGPDLPESFWEPMSEEELAEWGM